MVAHLLALEQGTLNRMTVPVPRVPRLIQQAAVLCTHTHTHRRSEMCALGHWMGVGSREPRVQLFVFTAAFPRLCKPDKDMPVPGTQYGATPTCSVQWWTPAQEGSSQASAPSPPSPSSPRQLSCFR